MNSNIDSLIYISLTNEYLINISDAKTNIKPSVIVNVNLFLEQDRKYNNKVNVNPSNTVSII